MFSYPIAVAPQGTTRAWLYGFGHVPAAPTYDMYLMLDGVFPCYADLETAWSLDITETPVTAFRRNVDAATAHRILASEYGRHVMFGRRSRGIVAAGGTGSTLTGWRVLGSHGVTAHIRSFGNGTVLNDSTVTVGFGGRVDTRDRCTVTTDALAHAVCGDDTEADLGAYSVARIRSGHVTCGRGVQLTGRWAGFITIGEDPDTHGALTVAGRRYRITNSGLTPAA